jgi:molecular chaperone GrpE
MMRRFLTFSRRLPTNSTLEGLILSREGTQQLSSISRTLWTASNVLQFPHYCSPNQGHLNSYHPSLLHPNRSIPVAGVYTSSISYKNDASSEENAKDENGQASASSADSNQEQVEAEEEEEDARDADQLKVALSKSIEDLTKEKKTAADLKEKLVRTLADMENLRERTARATNEAKQFAISSFVKSIVDVADNLERAAGSVPDLEDPSIIAELDKDRAITLLKSFHQGVMMTDDILMKLLGKEGVTRYDPVGDVFDPNLHNALFQVPDGTKEPGTIAVVIKKGYMLHDRPVRAAEVGVVAQSSE